jgi:hypothetical protein
MNKLTWCDIMAAEPGQYKTRFGLVEIAVDDLAIWKHFPQAEIVLRLGAFRDSRTEGEGLEINGGAG